MICSQLVLANRREYSTFRPENQQLLSRIIFIDLFLSLTPAVMAAAYTPASIEKVPPISSLP